MTHNSNNTADPTGGQAQPPKPVPLPVIPEHIPAELTTLDQWLIWRYFYKTDLGYWDKPPLDANKSGNAGKSTDPKTWATYEKALNSYQLGNLDGIGIALTDKNGIVGFDLDDCRDPETGIIDDVALKIVEGLPTYWEVSPSGTGLRGFAYGRKPGSRCRSGDFEMYSRGRYLCITGHHLEGTPTTIEPIQAGIDAVYAQIFPPQTRQTSRNGDSPSNNDEAILQHARAARNAEKFCTLFDDGDISSYEGDHSRADLALCRLLTFYTQDTEQVDRLFKASALYRPKWDRADYCEWTITRAIETTPEHWRGVSAESNGQPHDDAGDEYNTSSISDQIDHEPQEPEPLIHLTDRGNALRLIKLHGQNLHYIYRWKKWLVWDGTRWVVDEGNRVEAMAKQVIVNIYRDAKTRIDRVEKLIEEHGTGNGNVQKQREKEIDIANATLKWALKSESADKLAGMLKHAHSEKGIPITPEQLDGNPWILNCRNGTIDLKTGKLHKHRRDDLCTKRVDIDYDEHATCPEWNQFLYRTMGGPQEDDDGLEAALTERHERAQRLIGYLQRATGYSSTGVIREQVLQFMFGSGDNGKSTFSEVIAAMMGDYFQKAPQELLMRKAHHQTGGPSPELARLCGVRLVIAQEVDEKHRLNEAQVKDLTGNDTLTARGLYEDYFEFRPTHKIWMYGNHKPTIIGTDDAIWKRPKLIPFTEKIPKAEQVTDLCENHLIPELSGILAWAVRGCLEWQKNGLQVPKEVEVETQKYRNEMDLVSGFLDERCVSDKLHETLGADLHAAYLQYIEGDKEAHLSARKLYARLRERGYDSRLGHANKTLIIGLKLKPKPKPPADGQSPAETHA